MFGWLKRLITRETNSERLWRQLREGRTQTDHQNASEFESIGYQREATIKSNAIAKQPKR